MSSHDQVMISGTALEASERLAALAEARGNDGADKSEAASHDTAPAAFMPGLGDDLPGLVADVMGAMEALIAVLERESAALRKVDIAAVRKMAEEKGTLSRAYETAFQALRSRKDDLSELPESLRERLKETHERFSNAMADNLAALDTAQQASGRAVDLIVNAVRAAASRRDGYGEKGNPADSANLSISLNRTY